MTPESTETKAKLDPSKIREDFPILNQSIHRQKPLIYFDSGASSQRPQQVVQAMVDNYQKTYANVHRGTHWLSEESSRLFEEARLTLQKFINAQWSEEVIFTGGTTASINTVARSWGDANVKEGDEILLTLMEHHSNIVPWQQLAERTGATIRWVGITDNGMLDLEDLASKLNQRTKVLAVTAVSNTLSTINPVRKITKLAHQAAAIVVVDAAQCAPHEKMDVQKWGADFVAFSGHKMVGPSGIGILYGRRDLLQEMQPFLGGGSMIKTVTVEGYTPGDLPARFEAGTPPINEAIGLAAAADYLEQIGLPRIADHEKALAARAHETLADINGLRIFGPGPDHGCGIVTFVVDGVSAQDISVLLDLQGIAIRAGHHCTMPLHDHLKLSASCRASFYLYNTLDEVDQLARSLNEVLTKLR